MPPPESPSLAEAFGEALPADVATRLALVVGRASALWPAIAFDGPSLAAFLGHTERGRELVLAVAEPDDARIAELALAWSCARGDRAGLAAFDARYVAPLSDKLASMRLSPTALDEVKQHVREKLLLAPEGRRLRLEEYAGEGRLDGLVQVVATRAAIEAIRKQRKHVPLGPSDDALGSIDADADPERRALRARYRADIAAALESAARALTSRERSLLRLHLLGGVTLERLAEMFSVHRATIVRWLAQARATMLDETKKDLAQRLGARANEVDSVMSLLHSRLDLSIERLLRSSGDDE